MRMHAFCMECAQERREGIDPVFDGEVLDDCSIVGPCRRGHPNVIGLQMPKFDFLFECAARAFLDGYYRECVLGIATSIERFFEFYMRVVCRKRCISPEALAETWKDMRRSSERQRGAFAFTYMLHTGKSVDLRALEEKAKLRNRATHEGYQPSAEETLAYGEWARAELHRWMVELHAECSAEFVAETASRFAEIAANRVSPTSTRSMTTQSGWSCISALIPQEWGQGSFEHSLEILRLQLEDFHVRSEARTRGQDGAP
jgi:hypothetical protein